MTWVGLTDTLRRAGSGLCYLPGAGFPGVGLSGQPPTRVWPGCPVPPGWTVPPASDHAAERAPRTLQAGPPRPALLHGAWAAELHQSPGPLCQMSGDPGGTRMCAHACTRESHSALFPLHCREPAAARVPRCLSPPKCTAGSGPLLATAGAAERLRGEGRPSGVVNETLWPLLPAASAAVPNTRVSREWGTPLPGGL